MPTGYVRNKNATELVLRNSMVGIVHVLCVSSARYHMTFVIVERRGYPEC